MTYSSSGWPFSSEARWDGSSKNVKKLVTLDYRLFKHDDQPRPRAFYLYFNPGNHPALWRHWSWLTCKWSAACRGPRCRLHDHRVPGLLRGWFSTCILMAVSCCKNSRKGGDLRAGRADVVEVFNACPVAGIWPDGLAVFSSSSSSPSLSLESGTLRGLAYFILRRPSGKNHTRVQTILSSFNYG
jgi:hypothetical protein